MKIKRRSTAIGIVLTLITLSIVVDSCQKDYLVKEPAPVPKKAKQTETLEARYVQNGPSSVNSAYWNTADYLQVDLKNINTKELYNGDGQLNMTGTYDGLSDFNQGNTADVKLRAAYDDTKMYILIEWTDSDFDPSFESFLFDGKDDPRKPGSLAEGWTTQRNDDQVSLAFDISGSSSSAGVFSEVGCAASCHGGQMTPQSGKTDIWNWSLARSEPLGYALDMIADAANGFTLDQGTSMFTRNAVGDYRSGPVYEWNGEDMKITRHDGSTVLLDPGFYIHNDFKMPFQGDPVAGRSVYETECGETCHGIHGEGFGPDLDGPPFNEPGVMNRWTINSLKEFGSAIDHSGQSTFNKLSATEVANVIAKIRGFSGVPGYILSEPDGSNANITTSSNVKIGKIPAKGTGYKVLLIRDLSTGNADDIQFDLQTTLSYVFGIAFMDADGKNHVGSFKETLTIIPK